MMQPAITAFQVHASDNVATLLDEASLGSAVTVIGPAGNREISAHEKIAMGHKVALTSIREGEPVIKYGVVIGTAKSLIETGDWVHLHNCRSQLDERSGSFDLQTGAPPVASVLNPATRPRSDD